MFDFLSRGRTKAQKAEAGPSTSPHTVQLSATQRDMARLTLHHILKHHGIPAQWISGELIPIHISGQGEALLLQLEILQWHDALVLHAPALQQELLNGIRRFDPTANASRYLFSWKFSPQCGCPHTQLPDASLWATLTTPVVRPHVPSTPVAGSAFASPVRTSPDLSSTEEDEDDGFAPTQIPGI